MAMRIKYKEVLRHVSLWFLAALLGISCQTEALSPNDIFVKFYGGAARERAIDLVIQHGGNGFVILGSTNTAALLDRVTQAEVDLVNGLGSKDTYEVGAKGINEEDYYVIFTDLAGNQRRVLSFTQLRSDTIVDGTLADSRDIPHVIRKTQDGGYLIVGTSEYTVKTQGSAGANPTTRQEDIYIIKLNGSGGVVFEKIYGDKFYQSPVNPSNMLPSNEEGADAVEIADSYMIFGSTSQTTASKEGGTDPSVDLADFILFRIDKTTGEIIDENPNSVGFDPTVFGFSMRDVAVNILPLVAPGSPNPMPGQPVAIIMGTVESAAKVPVIAGDNRGGVNVLVANVDVGLAVTGSVSIGIDGDEMPYTMREASDGSFYITGTYSQSGGRDKSRGFLIEVGTSSNFLSYVRDIGGLSGNTVRGGQDVEIRDAVEAPSGFWVAGKLSNVQSGSQSSGAQMLVVRTLLTETYSGETEANYGGIGDDSFERIIKLEGSNQLVLLGTIDFEGGSTMMCLMKANQVGILRKP